MREPGLRRSTSGVSSLLGAMLIIALLITVIAAVRVIYFPMVEGQVAAGYFDAALQDLLAHKSKLDESAQNGMGASATTRIGMGGFTVPFIGLSSPGGTITADPGYGELSITAYSIDGLFLNMSGRSNLGSIEYRTNNYYGADRALHYEDGMVLLTQDSGRIALSSPGVTAVRNGATGMTDLMIIPIRIDGANVSYSSTGTCTLTSTISPRSNVYNGSRVVNVTLAVATAYPDEWCRALRGTFGSAGLKEGTDFTITTQGTGPTMVKAYVWNSSGNIRLDIYDTDFATTIGAADPLPQTNSAIEP